MTTFEKHSKANKMKSMVNTNRNLHLTLRYRRGPFEKTLVETKGDERKIGYFVFHFIQPLVESRNLYRPENDARLNDYEL